MTLNPIICSRRHMLGSGVLLAATFDAIAPRQANATSVQHGYVNNDGLDIYYEIHGQLRENGPVPLVLLHGGAVTIEAAFAQSLISRFASRRPVIAIEQQGHGHTGDRPNSPMTINQMVKDTAAVISQLGAKQVDFFGHSLGGIIAVGLTISHPNIVRTVTTLGSPYNLEGFRPDLVLIQRDPMQMPSVALQPLLPTEADMARWRASFQRSAPDPNAFDSILTRLNTMLATWSGWTQSDLRGIDSPTLVAVGDNDYVQISHAVEMAHLIPLARLAVLPGTTHLGIVNRDAWLEPMMDSLSQSAI
jgi:pimeloyl-ACP methyl ester carboxylesterase